MTGRIIIEKDTGESKAMEIEEKRPEGNEAEAYMKSKRPARKQQWTLGLLILMASYLYVTVSLNCTELSDWLMEITWFATGERTDLYQVMAWLYALFAAAYVGIGVFYTGWQKREIPKHSWGYLALLLASALWFPLCGNVKQDMAGYMVLFLHGIAVYWLTVLTDQRRESELSLWAVADLFRGFVIFSFGRFFQIWKEAGLAFLYLIQTRGMTGKKKNDRSGNGLLVLIGVVVCLPLLAVVVPILLCADPYVMQATRGMLQWMAGLFLEWLGEYHGGYFPLNVICVGLVGSYLYGLFYSCFYEEKPKPAPEYHAPSALLIGFLAPLLALYGLFFMIRFAGIAGAMGQIAEGDLWVSTYAREGFFELCWIAAINFGVFAVVHRVSVQNGRIMQVLLSILGAETLAFVVLAFSKMWYYIRTYQSFTFKRAMCCWLLLTLFVTFGLMMGELWNRKIKGVKWGVIFGCVTFLLMAYSNMPAWAP